MRASKAIGAALAVFVAAAVALAWVTPPVAAASQQAVIEHKQAAGQTGTIEHEQAQQQNEKKIEKQVIVKKEAGKPAEITVTEQGSGDKVISHAMIGEPMIAAALAAGPRLGVQIRDLTKEDLAKLKIASLNGVYVVDVAKDTAAAKAGVKAGDVAVQYDGENVRSVQQFRRLVQETVAGRTVKLGVMRDGKRVDVDVAPETSDAALKLEGLQGKLGDMFTFNRRVPEPGPQPVPPGGRTFRWRQETPVPIPEGDTMQWFGQEPFSYFFSTGRGRLGVTVQELTPDLATYFGVKDGLLVNTVRADSPAAKAGIKAGDVIGTVNGKAVTTSSELVKELADKDGDVTIGVTRDRKPLSLKATLEPRDQPRRVGVPGRPA
ncbi:MAG: degP1 2 [Acidobacteria bacterium]|nr:degP1 2 [Acidobacteriota bacterium]